mgnify:CR=1 FL=1
MDDHNPNKDIDMPSKKFGMMKEKHGEAYRS